MPAKYFITHSWHDIEFAKRLTDDLRKNDLDGFFDAYSIRPGDIISQEINRGLEECEIYVPILSRAALASPWCEEEIHLAITLSRESGRDGRPRIVPIIIEDCYNDLPISIKARLHIDFTKDYNEAFHNLLVNGFVNAGVDSKGQQINGTGEKEAVRCVSQGINSFFEGNYDRAAAYFSLAIELNPANADAYFNRGKTNYAQRNYQQAIDDFSKAIKIQDDYVDAYFYRGNVYNSLELYPRREAIKDFSKVIELQPYFSLAYIHRGISQSTHSTYDKAIADFSKAIELNPNNADVYKYRADCYNRKQSYEHKDRNLILDSVADLKSYLRFAPFAFDRGKIEQEIKRLEADMDAH